MKLHCLIGAIFWGSALFASCNAYKQVSTFVVLPDTQTYLEQCPEVFDSQVDWLVANRKTKEIDVRTYSTWNKSYHPSGHHNFKFREVDFGGYLKH